MKDSIIKHAIIRGLSGGKKCIRNEPLIIIIHDKRRINSSEICYTIQFKQTFYKHTHNKMSIVKRIVSDLRWEFFRRQIQSNHEILNLMFMGASEEALEKNRENLFRYGIAESFCRDFVAEKIGMEEVVGALKDLELPDHAAKVEDAVRREAEGEVCEDDQDVVEGFEALDL